MICRYCSKEVLDGSIFCSFCGERLARKSRKQYTPSYPKPRILADGTLLGQLMVEGRRETIKAMNEKEYRARIDAIRAGVIELKAHPDRRPLQQIVRSYIDRNDGVLSPATIRGYEYIYKGRFKAYMPLQVGKIDAQRMINDEAKKYAPKTVKNAWALIEAAMRDAGIPVPEVNLPAIPPSDEDYLDHTQILSFLEAIKGDSCELAAILMLHSLRMSELLKLDADDVTNGIIHVRGAIVRDKHDKMIEKKTNKNRTSTREIPVMIPRLNELLPAEGRLVEIPPSTIAAHIERACRKAKVPVCSPHDIRRSFASLGYHLHWSERAVMALGGWSNLDIVHRIYIKLSKSDIQADVQKMQNYYGITTDSKKSSV